MAKIKVKSKQSKKDKKAANYISTCPWGIAGAAAVFDPLFPRENRLEKFPVE